MTKDSVKKDSYKANLDGENMAIYMVGDHPSYGRNFTNQEGSDLKKIYIYISINKERIQSG